jgi:hypothetical protein
MTITPPNEAGKPPPWRSARWQSCPIVGSDERARAPFGIEARPLLAFGTIFPEEK